METFSAATCDKINSANPKCFFNHINLICQLDGHYQLLYWFRVESYLEYKLINKANLLKELSNKFAS